MRIALVAMIAAAACGDSDHELAVTVFTRQTDWVHPSNPTASMRLAELGATRGWQVTVSDDPRVFSAEHLARTDVVVFSVTSGNVLDATARANLEPFFRSGGGFVGIHSASHTEWDWPFYLAQLVPVTFATHPSPVNVQPGRLTIESADSITEGISTPWTTSDEFYSFAQRPEAIAGLTMLVALDESSLGADYNPPKLGYHPLAFAHELSGGRSFYTALGHTPEAYSDDSFVAMLVHGIEWAGKRLP